MEFEIFFEEPMQVLFYDPDMPNNYRWGIGLGNQILCPCCGSLIPIELIQNAAKTDGFEEPCIISLLLGDWIPMHLEGEDEYDSLD